MKLPRDLSGVSLAKSLRKFGMVSDLSIAKHESVACSRLPRLDSGFEERIFGGRLSRHLQSDMIVASPPSKYLRSRGRCGHAYLLCSFHNPEIEVGGAQLAP
jgi:hypothetical protein